jgi:hypothetical protein
VAPLAAILILPGEKAFWQSAASKIFIGFLHHGLTCARDKLACVA